MSVLSSPLEKESMGERLALIRKELALTQNQMAISLGVSHRAYTNYERGEREMPAGFLLRLLKKHNYDPVWVMNGIGEKPQIFAHRAFDPKLMSDVFCLIHDWLEKRQKQLASKKLIDIVNLAYELCAQDGEVDPNQIATVVKFAA